MTDSSSPADHPVFALSSEMVETYASLRPDEATFAGIAGHDHEWPDPSSAGHDALATALADMRTRMASVDPGTDSWSRLARRVALDWLDLEIEHLAHDEHLRDLNSVDSGVQVFREVFEVMDTSTEAGWDAIVTRLETIDRVLAGYRDALEEGRRRGLAVARRQVRAAIDEAARVAGPESFFRTLPAALADSPAGTAELAARLDAAVPAACAAYGEVARYLEEGYLPSAAPADAVGEERYRRLVRRFLGTDLDLHETYGWGWEEVARLRAEMSRVADAIRPGASIGQAIEVLKSDPARLAHSREEFLAVMRDRQEDALRRLDGSHFDVPPPVRKIDVKIAPPRGSLGAYYTPPSEDFGRAGCVWYSLGSEDTVALYDEVSTAYHEGFPGHHLQCGIQVALADRLSRVHRLLVWYAGYGEGWALYAEQLMHELGFLDKPDYVMGMLAAQLLRACRVVIDIGSHLALQIPEDQPFHPGESWSFGTAVEMLMEYATLDVDYARSEVIRYLGWPGQAISYKVGERAILALREEARRRSGPDFDVKAFHGRVLGHGPVGLDLLRDLVLPIGSL